MSYNTPTSSGVTGYNNSTITSGSNTSGPASSGSGVQYIKASDLKKAFDDAADHIQIPKYFLSTEANSSTNPVKQLNNIIRLEWLERDMPDFLRNSLQNRWWADSTSPYELLLPQSLRDQVPYAQSKQQRANNLSQSLTWQGKPITGFRFRVSGVELDITSQQGTFDKTARFSLAGYLDAADDTTCRIFDREVSYSLVAAETNALSAEALVPPLNEEVTGRWMSSEEVEDWVYLERIKENQNLPSQIATEWDELQMVANTLRESEGN
ncbi:hypothetical protein CI109_102693 [Kwoniella shandongensis]|uniref:Uncharacterized protein n=1 Tax=Kwoniella shandongensis TaxID=1734106 RepID=A0A5M6BRI6_9TREE|nr:uncharacterized protein CI109_007107 [Kwoniella shandongensis]KAA5524560.1 hypothetical protein CI109_007107 [Kwoniella shandongensis]